jgi:hypothetical protein
MMIKYVNGESLSNATHEKKDTAANSSSTLIVMTKQKGFTYFC